MKNPFKEDREFGLVPDTEQDKDPRNIYWQDLAPLGAVEENLPASVFVEESLRNLNQGHTSSCTCHALVHVVSMLEGLNLSPRHAFWKIKTDPKYRSSQIGFGAFMIDPIKLICNEGIQPYSVIYDELDTKNDEMYIKAPPTQPERIKGGSYVYVTSGSNNADKWQQIARYIAYEKKPLLVGIQWRTSFNKARSGGVVPAVEPTGKSVGHAMVADGYEYKSGELYIRFQNSFGDSWGDKGKIWLPTRYTVIQSAISYIPPDDAANIGIVKPEPVTERNAFLEKANADAIWKAVDAAFPRVGDVDANAKNNIARSLYAKNKLLFIQAMTYRGWKTADFTNYLYAHSRNKTKVSAYSLDFTKQR